MAQLNLLINSARDAATLKAAFETPGASAQKSILNKLANYIISVGTGTEGASSQGAPSIAISIPNNAVQASGTFTVSAGGSSNNETCVVAGVTFTAKTSGATGNQFNISATAATQASNMAAAFNASSNLSGIVTASASGGVVTITAVQPGLMGNGIAISESLTNVAASGALLTGGAADPSALTLNF